jgi:hypothetical protein
MSLEIILIPMAIALITKAKANAEENVPNASAHQVSVETRMKNQDLLVNAMQSAGCTVTATQNEIAGNFHSILFTFKRDTAGIWNATFVAGTTLQAASQIIQAIDKAYGLEVQSEVLRKIKERAPQNGMALESETVNEDSSISLVLTVNQS